MSLLLTAAVVFSGCGDLLGLGGSDERADILCQLGSQLVLFDLRSGDMREVGSPFVRPSALVESEGENALYGISREHDGVMFRLDLEDFRSRWRSLDDLAATSGIEGLHLAERLLGLTPPGDGLLVVAYVPGTGEYGLAEIGLDDWEVRRYIPMPVYAEDLRVLAPSPRYPNGVVALLGSPDHDPLGESVVPAEGWLALLSWPSLEVEDTVVFREDPRSVLGGVLRLAPDPQDEKIFIQGTDRVFSVDIGSLTVEESSARLDGYRYFLHMSDDGESLFMTDDPFYSSSPGLLQVLNRDLEMEEPIDLSGAERPIDMIGLLNVGDTVVVGSSTGWVTFKVPHKVELLVASRSGKRLLTSYPLDHVVFSCWRAMF